MNRAPSATFAVAALAAALATTTSVVAAPNPVLAPPQEVDSLTENSPLGFSASARSSDVSLMLYRPLCMAAEELRALANELFGDSLVVEFYENGERVSSTEVAHFLTFGDCLMIRDTNPSAAQITDLLRQLEEVEWSRREQLRVRETAQQEEDRRQQQALEREYADQLAAQQQSLQRIEIRPRFVSLPTLKSALFSFERTLPAGATETQRQNFTLVEAANVLLVEDEPARLEQITRLAALIDQPQPQITISACILKAGGDAGNSGVPGELASALTKMNLGANFKLLSSGTLRSSVQAQRFCELGNQDANGASWKLQFLPIACDPASGNVTLSECSFVTEAGLDPTAGPNRQPASQDFRCDVTFGLDEWLVLGAVGAQPTLVALRVSYVAPPKVKPN